jgi:hypothetical protein
MNPGAIIKPETSKDFVLGGIGKEPIAAMRSPLIAISPKTAILPVPSKTSPPLRIKSASRGAAAKNRKAKRGRSIEKSLKPREK